MRKNSFGRLAVVLVCLPAGCGRGTDSAAPTMARAELEAVSLDNAMFAASDLGPAHQGPRQTISVSFFVGRVGPVHNGQARWTNTDSNDADPFSVELSVPEGFTQVDPDGTPHFFTSFAGINFHHVPPAPPANPPSFDFKTDRTGASDGSPRLVMIFSDGGNINLRPLTWEQDKWISEGPGNTSDPAFVNNWESNGGTCGFVYEQPYDVVLGCHAGQTITDAFIVTDSGWANAPYKNWIDNIQYGGTTISQPSDNMR